VKFRIFVGSVAAFVSCLIAPVAAAESDEEKIAKLVALPPSALMGKITVKDDVLSPRIEINTVNVIAIERKGLIGGVDEPAFLRGYIDKNTGVTTAQIYHVARYSGSGWHFYNTGTYLIEGQLEQVETLKAGSDVDCSRYGCTHWEHVIINVPFERLERLAKDFSQDNGIRYRLMGKSGNNLDYGIPANEIAAFVQTVNRYRGVEQAPVIVPAAPLSALPTLQNDKPSDPDEQKTELTEKADRKNIAPGIMCVTCD